jgi:GNAT superfamily N-acetyltransferase
VNEAIEYAVENDLGADEFVDVLRRSTLAERRPVDEPLRIRSMLANANLIVTARASSRRLVGVSRCLTDFAFCCYCSDLAVDASYQGRGVGRALIEKSAAEAGEEARFILLSAPMAVSFYERIGLERIPDAFARPGWRRDSSHGAQIGQGELS